MSQRPNRINSLVYRGWVCIRAHDYANRIYRKICFLIFVTDSSKVKGSIGDS